MGDRRKKRPRWPERYTLPLPGCHLPDPKATENLLGKLWPAVPGGHLAPGDLAGNQQVCEQLTSLVGRNGLALGPACRITVWTTSWGAVAPDSRLAYQPVE